MLKILDIISEINLNEYTDEEKQQMGIPPNAVSRGGKWYVGDEYVGYVDTQNKKFVPAAVGGGDTSAPEDKNIQTSPSNASVSSAPKLNAKINKIKTKIDNGISRKFEKFFSKRSAGSTFVSSVDKNNIKGEVADYVWDAIFGVDEITPDRVRLGYALLGAEDKLTPEIEASWEETPEFLTDDLWDVVADKVDQAYADARNAASVSENLTEEISPNTSSKTWDLYEWIHSRKK